MALAPPRNFFADAAKFRPPIESGQAPPSRGGWGGGVTFRQLGAFFTCPDNVRLLYCGQGEQPCLMVPRPGPNASICA